MEFITLKQPNEALPANASMKVNVVPWFTPTVDVSGTGYISGVVMVKGTITPDVICSLYDEETGSFVENKISDAAGAYRFDNLDITRKFFVIVKEPTGLWEYRVQSRITPVI